MANCEYCGKFNNGLYGSGRFCCQSCARGFSTKAKRSLINGKVSKRLTTKQQSEHLAKIRQLSIQKLHNEKMARKVYMYVGKDKKRIELDITWGELEEYRKLHPVCEICGKPERISLTKNGEANKLCIDHDHKTNKFRGLLCSKCNFSLGWLENLNSEIEKYVSR